MIHLRVCGHTVDTRAHGGLEHTVDIRTHCVESKADSVGSIEVGRARRSIESLRHLTKELVDSIHWKLLTVLADGTADHIVASEK